MNLDKAIFTTLFFSIFATVTGVGIVVPLLPVYAHDLGAGGLYIGLIFGSFSLSRTFFLPYFGRQSDRKGRKPYIVVGLISYALISIAFIFAKNIEALIIIRFIQGIASAMIMPIVQAYVGDITPTGKEGFTMGLFNMSVFLGLSIGPLMGGFINNYFSLHVAFACMGLLAFIGFILSFFLLPPVGSEQAIQRARDLTSWKQLLRDSDIAGFFFFRMAYTTAIGIIWGFMPVFADTEFSLSSSSIGVLIMLGVFTSGLIQTPMGFLADRMDPRRMVISGGLLTGFAIFSFKWAGGFHDLFIANLIFGLGGGIAMPALMALSVLKGNRTKAMGSVMSLLTVSHSLGMLVGSIVGGVLMDLFQLRQAFTFGAFFMLLGVVLFSICTYRRGKKTVFD
jgi:MFS transporter, DHA1 family, multidrug resistance protein